MFDLNNSELQVVIFIHMHIYTFVRSSMAIFCLAQNRIFYSSYGSLTNKITHTYNLSMCNFLCRTKNYSLAYLRWDLINVFCIGKMVVAYIPFRSCCTCHRRIVHTLHLFCVSLENLVYFFAVCNVHFGFPCADILLQHFFSAMFSP